MVAGVCGGIAAYYDIDPTLVRLLAVVLSLASAGAALVAYIVMAIVVPEEGSVVASEGGPTVSATPEPPQAGPATGPSQPAGLPSPPSYVPTAPASPVAPEPDRPRGRGGIVFGLVLVFVGLALLASQFVPGLDLWKLWPLIIVAVGIRTMLKGGD